jgi:hypothetical protein
LIAIYQSVNDYPELHLILTDNLRYLAGRKTFKDIDEALAAIKKWMEKNATVGDTSKRD